MIKGYEYKSDFARFYVAEGQTKGREKTLDSFRRAVIETVSARWPGLRDDLATRLHGLPEATLAQIAVELGAAHDEGSARTVLDGLPGQPEPAPDPDPEPAPMRATSAARKRSRPAVASRRGRRAARP